MEHLTLRQDRELVAKVNTKMKELVDDGWLLNVTKTKPELKFHQYYEFVKYDKDLLIEDLVAIGIVGRWSNAENGMVYFMQIIEPLKDETVKEEVRLF